MVSRCQLSYSFVFLSSPFQSNNHICIMSINILNSMQDEELECLCEAPLGSPSSSFQISSFSHPLSSNPSSSSLINTQPIIPPWVNTTRSGSKSSSCSIGCPYLSKKSISFSFSISLFQHSSLIKSSSSEPDENPLLEYGHSSSLHSSRYQQYIGFNLPHTFLNPHFSGILTLRRALAQQNCLHCKASGHHSLQAFF